jgi:hypothetical protein
MIGDIIHPLASSNFNDYWYTSILIPNGVAATINGTSLPSMTSAVILPIGLSKQSDATGSIFLIGRKKFGATSGYTGTWENPLSNDNGNAKGSYSIK